MENKNRRTRGEGTVYRHASGSWVCQITLPNGIRKTVSGRTKSIAIKRLNELRNKVSKGESTERNATRVGEFLKRWIDESARLAVRESTLVRYRSVIENHVLPFSISKMRMDKIEPKDIQAFYSEVKDSGASPRMVRMVHQVLHVALNNATKSGVLNRNPASAVSAPKYRAAPVRALPVEDILGFLDAAKSDRFYPLYLLSIASGMRQGELLALEWDCVDFAKNAITVRASLQEVRGRLIVTEPKTQAGRRQIAIPVEVMDELRSYRTEQQKTAPKSKLVFPDTNGKHMRRSNLLNRSFHPILKRAGLAFRFHHLRHAHASLLLHIGASVKEVQMRLGHSGANVTLDVYSHLLPNAQTETAKRLGDVLSARKTD